MLCVLWVELMMYVKYFSSRNCPKMCGGNGNDQYSLMEFELAMFLEMMMLFIVNSSCASQSF